MVLEQDECSNNAGQTGSWDGRALGTGIHGTAIPWGRLALPFLGDTRHCLSLGTLSIPIFPFLGDTQHSHSLGTLSIPIFQFHEDSQHSYFLGTLDIPVFQIHEDTQHFNIHTGSQDREYPHPDLPWLLEGPHPPCSSKAEQSQSRGTPNPNLLQINHCPRLELLFFSPIPDFFPSPWWWGRAGTSPKFFSTRI